MFQGPLAFDLKSHSIELLSNHKLESKRLALELLNGKKFEPFVFMSQLSLTNLVNAPVISGHYQLAIIRPVVRKVWLSIRWVFSGYSPGYCRVLMRRRLWRFTEIEVAIMLPLGCWDVLRWNPRISR